MEGVGNAPFQPISSSPSTASQILSSCPPPPLASSSPFGVPLKSGELSPGASPPPSSPP